MAAQNYVIDLSDLTANDILALIWTSRIDPTAKLVDLSGKVEPIAVDTKQRLLSLQTNPPFPSD